MYAASYIVAASQLFALAFGAPLLSSNAQQARSLVERAAYKVFGGDGSVAQGWPAESEWVAFEDAWNANVDTMKMSCSQFSMENNSDDEIANIKKAIEEVSGETSIKKEFILAIVMQESKGCVRAPTTNYGFDNPGLMQSFQGAHSCNPSGTGIVPCPPDQIKGMIQDGAGVGIEAGLGPALKKAGGSDASQYYKAARIYNSGSIDSSGNLGAGIATHCYASDVANRLIGWTDNDQHGCEEASIGSVGGGAPSSSTPPTGDQDTENQTPPPPTTTTTTTPPAGGDSQPTGEKFPGAAANCAKWYTVQSGDGCASTGVDIATLTSLNTGLNADCSNLWLGASYCIGA